MQQIDLNSWTEFKSAVDFIITLFQTEDSLARH